MGITFRPTGTFTLVYSADEAFADNVAARIARKEYERHRDASVFTPEMVRPGGALVKFTCEHLSRGALDYIDGLYTPNHRRVAAFRCGVTSMTGPGTETLVTKREDTVWGGKFLSEEAMDSISGPGGFPMAVLYEIGGALLTKATLGDGEKKVSSPPRGSPSEE